MTSCWPTIPASRVLQNRRRETGRASCLFVAVLVTFGLSCGALPGLSGPGFGVAAGLAQEQQQSGQQQPEYREGRGEYETVLIHGLGANASVWDDVLPYLRGTFKVWTYELHGHGTTQPLPDPTIAKEAAALGQFLVDNDIPRPVLVGHGMGGLIAMRFAFDNPRDVERLVIIDAAPRQLATTADKAHVAESLLKDYDRFVASRYLNYSPEPELSNHIVDMALKTDSASFISLVMSSFDFDLTDELSRQAIPILVIGSAMFFPHEDSNAQALDRMGYSSARTISFKRVAQTGHYIMLERPVYLASILLAFGAYDEFR